MSAAGTGNAVVLDPPRVELGAARTLQLCTAAAVLPLGLTAALLGLTADHLATPVAFAVFHAYNVCAALLIGLVWWVRRPHSRFGPLLVVFGLLWFVVALQGSGAPALFTAGVIAQVPMYVLTFALCMTFPSGRLAGRAERAIVALMAFAVLLSLIAFLYQPEVPGGGVFTACTPECPSNPIAILGEPAWAGVSEAVRGLAIWIVPAAVTVLFASRFRHASRPRRRALGAVAVGSLPLLVAFSVYQFARRTLGASEATLDVLAWFVFAGRVIFPLGFLVALLQSELFAQAALRKLLADLAGRTTLERWRGSLARALDDPSLELRVRGDADVAPAEGRLWVPVGSSAALVTDDALAEEPELLGAASAATIVAMQTEDLAREVREATARVVEAGDAERKRLVRDLHDSAQQRLVALRMRLGIEEARDPETFARLKSELDEALDELRSLAHGLYPPLLSRYGVGPSLRAVARASAIPVTVEDGDAARHPQAVESCAYFCCLEAMQNAAKHAGTGAEAAVTLAAAGGGLRFEVRDDGAGFDPERVRPGAGLTNIADRLEAVGGRLEIDSAPGRGTRVAGTIPAAR